MPNRPNILYIFTDPGEMVNLAVEKRYTDVLSSHRAMLKDFAITTADHFSVPE